MAINNTLVFTNMFDETNHFFLILNNAKIYKLLLTFQKHDK